MILTILIVLSTGGLFLYTSIPQQVYNSEIFGNVIKNQIWSGHITVTGDIIVMPWVNLTILPGTIVVISANEDNDNLFGQETCDGIENYDLLVGMIKEENDACGAQPNEPYRDEAHHISIIIRGTLKAVGTENNRIIFKSDSLNPTRYDWNRLEINAGILSYATVSDYRILATGEDNVEVSYNILRNIGECAICLNSSNANILSNWISDAGHELIDMHNSSPAIRSNHLGPNPNLSCITIYGGEPQISDNTIKNCGSAISLLVPPNDPEFENRLQGENTFLNNAEDFYHEY